MVFRQLASQTESHRGTHIGLMLQLQYGWSQSRARELGLGTFQSSVLRQNQENQNLSLRKIHVLQYGFQCLVYFFHSKAMQKSWSTWPVSLGIVLTRSSSSKQSFKRILFISLDKEQLSARRTTPSAHTFRTVLCSYKREKKTFL